MIGGWLSVGILPEPPSRRAAISESPSTHGYQTHSSCIRYVTLLAGWVGLWLVGGLVGW